MKTIVVDTLNNENGSQNAIKAAYKWAFENPNYTLILFGNNNDLKQLNINLPHNIIFKHSPSVVTKTSNIRDVLKQPSSMLDAVEFTKQNDVDALLSSGDSGSLVTITTLKLKRLQGISRPAFMPLIPKQSGKQFLLLDVGANTETKTEYLIQWSKIATIFYKSLLNEQTPKLALLNIGTEEYKGPTIQQEAHQILKNSNNLFKYSGFIEPNNILKDDIDIVISDGYAGNILLKSMEGAYSTLFTLLKNAFMSSFITKIAALLLKKQLKIIKNKFDYKKIGAATIIGFDKIVAKAHGRSNEDAFYSALNQLKQIIEARTINKMQKYLAEIEDNNE
ncbi:phosphate acyltransferase PlsX [Mycoplasma miroungirhinis]|uniref:Phosphate acyltransferase n=1 Tax=Mycoplasma miroungirhinis TaxID=754516 RepID=A0A6M4JBI4_9MOLU|nr:phosphate acyltransferase PlsX [Mycoplasma miroungirhinis]QJR44363.1 phosphate acyltransferase PlsX [Mycoplasma miroungirhinis]